MIKKFENFQENLPPMPEVGEEYVRISTMGPGVLGSHKILNSFTVEKILEPDYSKQYRAPKSKSGNEWDVKIFIKGINGHGKEDYKTLRSVEWKDFIKNYKRKSVSEQLQITDNLENMHFLEDLVYEVLQKTPEYLQFRRNWTESIKEMLEENKGRFVMTHNLTTSMMFEIFLMLQENGYEIKKK